MMGSSFGKGGMCMAVAALGLHTSAGVSLAGDWVDVLWLTGGHSGSSPVFVSPGEDRLIARGGEKTWRLDDGALESVTTPRSSGRAISADGALIAGILPNHAIEIWRLSDASTVQTFSGHTDTVQDLAFSPDGLLVASASRDKSVKIWRLSDGQVRTLSGHMAMARAVAFSPDGALLASGSQDKTVRLWRVSDGLHLGTFSGHAEYVSAVAFSPDSTLLATTSGDKTVRLWRTSDRALMATLAGHDWPAVDIEFTPDGQFVVSCAIDWTVRVWRVSDAALVRTINVGAYPSSLAMFADSAHAAVGTDENPRILRLSDGVEVARIGVFTQPITSVGASPDGQWVAAAEPDTLEERLHILRADTGEVVRTLSIGDQAQEQVSPLTLAPDWSFFVTRDAGGRNMFIRSMADGSLIRTLTGHVSVIYETAVSPDGAYIASAGEYQSALWRVSDGAHIRFFEDNFTVGFHAVAFSPDGALVAGGALGEGRIWRVDDGSEAARFDHPEAFFVETLAFSPDGALLASGGTGGSLKLFSATNGALARTLAGHAGDVSSLAFARDGRRLFSSGHDGRIRVWDVNTGVLLFDFDKGVGRRVESVALLPGERTFAFGSDDVFVGLARNPLRKPQRRGGVLVQPR